MKVLIAGGGTGGHVYPLIPVANEFVKNGHSVFFVGRKNSIEEKNCFFLRVPIKICLCISI